MFYGRSLPDLVKNEPQYCQWLLRAAEERYSSGIGERHIGQYERESFYSQVHHFSQSMFGYKPPAVSWPRIRSLSRTVQLGVARDFARSLSPALQ